MRLIHYTCDKIELEYRIYDQSKKKWQEKPEGLWISVGEAWKKWCENERFYFENLSYSYEVVLKQHNSVLHLKTPEEVFEFGKKYPLKTMSFDHENDTDQLDWNKVKKEHSGIIISPYQWPCRLSLKSGWYYGWDCSSGCIWDLDCIEEFKFVKEENLLGVFHD
jgi:hypothetical protein